MPWEGHLQGHSKISDSVQYYSGDVFSVILLGYQSGEIQVGRKGTEKQVGTKYVCLYTGYFAWASLIQFRSHCLLNERQWLFNTTANNTNRQSLLKGPHEVYKENCKFVMEKGKTKLNYSHIRSINYK